jgi:hypothetical protein
MTFCAGNQLVFASCDHALRLADTTGVCNRTKSHACFPGPMLRGAELVWEAVARASDPASGVVDVDLQEEINSQRRTTETPETW